MEASSCQSAWCSLDKKVNLVQASGGGPYLTYLVVCTDLGRHVIPLALALASGPASSRVSAKEGHGVPSCAKEAALACDDCCIWPSLDLATVVADLARLTSLGYHRHMTSTRFLVPT